MPSLTDQKYLKEKQYRNADRLKARAYLQQQFSTNSYSWWSWIFDHFRFPSESRILELGCGTGFLWSWNRERIEQKWRVTLSDLSLGMAKETRENLMNTNGNFYFAVLDAQNIPSGDEVFDAVIANHMLYHVPSLEAALSEIKRVLRPGGKFFATTIGKNHMHEMKAFRRKFYPLTAENDWDCIAEKFGLDNGEAILRQWFSEVQQWQYEDSLSVTEAEPMVAYIRSNIHNNVGKETDAEFRAYLKKVISVDGTIQITKESGLLEAKKAE